MRMQIRGTLVGALLAVLMACAAPAAAQAAFGVQSFEGSWLNAEGSADTLAGSHPASVTVGFEFSTTQSSTGATEPEGNAKDIEVELPAGLIGNPAAIPHCTQAEMFQSASPECPADSQIGTEKLVFSAPPGPTEPVYNMVPPPGVPAEFAFKFSTTVVPIIASVRTGGDYGITLHIDSASTQAVSLYKSSTTFWGVPAEYNGGGGAPTPFLTLPTSCTGPLTTTLRADSWQEPGHYATASFLTQNASGEPAGMSGCENLEFKPSIDVQPDTGAADSPTGLDVELKVPQSEATAGLAAANLKDAKVELPAGMAVNPAVAAGLVGCPLEGSEGVNLHSAAPAACPNASKIGTVSIKTPLLEEELTGGVYVAQQGNLPGLGSNPFGSLLAMYVVAEGSGVSIKLAGKIEAEPLTGKLTTTFDENPQLPFSDLKLDLFDGQNAALSTPSCGTYSASAALTSYSSAEAVSVPSPPFTVSSGCGKGFAPSLAAGSINPQAGASSPFTLTLKRNDTEQEFSTVAVKMPKGLAGLISQVPLCSEAQANAGNCPDASKIGHVAVQAGVGSEPVTLPEAGRQEDPVYLTGPYKGAPFGLSIVVHPEAGPFNLEEGHPVVVRAQIAVDPSTAQVSVVSDPMPTILQGIPLDVKAINVTIDREGFMFNPTSCEPMSLTGTIGSAQGASEAVSSRFQAGDCAALPFKPSFAADTHANHTKANGEYLHVLVKSGAGQANIAKMHVTLPKKLPSRLSTLKLACPAAQFAKDPAGCPSGAFVGTVTAHTPVLPVPLQGSALFVSHGGAGFPNLDFVMQGDGVSIDLVGETFISKQGITTSTFNSLPDMPISSFELTLPTGPHSVLAGNGDFCAAPLYMPTTITGQNGAIVNQKTQISVSGCKPQIRVIGKQVKNGRATISVSVPAAGELTVSGKDVEPTSKSLEAAGKAKITVRVSAQGRRLVSGHPRRRLQATVHLRFRPTKGKPILASTKVLIG